MVHGTLPSMGAMYVIYIYVYISFSRNKSKITVEAFHAIYENCTIREESSADILSPYTSILGARAQPGVTRFCIGKD